MNALHALWQQRSLRERRLLVLAAALLALALLWSWALAPALQTWRSAPQRQAELDQQSRQMLQWQAQARQLQKPARLSRAEAQARLQAASTALLGEGAQLSLQGELLRVQLQAAPAEGLARWLAQAREQAQALPQSVQLEQQGNDPQTVRWRGQLLLRLP